MLSAVVPCKAVMWRRVQSFLDVAGIRVHLEPV